MRRVNTLFRLNRFTYRGASYSAAFVNSLALLALITSVVILVIGSNLARAFELVGAMSIIRFRTAVRIEVRVGCEVVLR